MKKALSIVLSVAMLMTCIFTMFVVPASANENIVELLDTTYIVEGAENVAVNDDGSWTITGKVALAVNIEYDLDVVKNIYQKLDAVTPIKITLYDGYADKWIGLYDNWVGPQFFPAGVYDGNNGVDGIYNWNSFATKDGKIATLTSVYFEFEDPAAANEATVYQLYLNDGTLKPAEVHLFPENNFDELSANWNCYDLLAFDNADQWIGTAADKSGNSDIIVSYDEENWVMNFGNTNGGWPSASVEVNKAVDYYTSALDIDLSVLNGAQTTLYVFFGDATPDDFEGAGKAYGTILADVYAGNYYGTVMLSDILPEDSDVIDENGMVNVSYVKLFATSGNTPMNPAVTVNYIDLCYYEENPAPEGLGDIDLDDDVDTFDTLVCFSAAVKDFVLTEEEYDRADYDRDTMVTIFDALGIFCEAAGIDLSEVE